MNNNSQSLLIITNNIYNKSVHIGTTSIATIAAPETNSKITELRLFGYKKKTIVN